MGLCGTKNGSSMASFEEPFEAPLFLRVYCGSQQQHSLTLRTFLYSVTLKKFRFKYSNSVDLFFFFYSVLT